MLRDLFLQIVRASGARRRALAALLLFCAGVLPRTVGAEVKPIRRVLVFYEVGPNYPAIALIDQGISDTLRSLPYQIEVYREYLDTALFPDLASQQQFREWYTRKYRDRRPDAIITVGPSALAFMIAAHEPFFRDVPVVFCTSTEEAAGRAKLDSHFTGVWEEPEPTKTLEAALRLKPYTKHVFVVGGTSPYDRSVEALYRERLHTDESKLDFKYLTDLAMPQLLDRLRDLPEQSVILYVGILRDAAGTQFIDATEAGPMVVRAANAPVFTFSDLNLGHGEVGGDLLNLAGEGKMAGTTVLRILRGERPQDIPIVRNVNVYMFDWRVLNRWGLDENSLPPGSIVLNRQPGFWELYKRYVVVALVVLIAQSGAILGLLWQRERRRKAEAELRKSEEKFSKSFRQSPLAITIVRINDDCYVDVNETFENQTGWRRDQVIGRSPLEINLWVDPDQRSVFLNQLVASGKVRDFEVKFRRKDNQIRTGLGSTELMEVNGEPCALSVIADITERKLAEEALAGLSGRLIEAQEAERTRIARELHDDINQRLAIVAVNLKTVKQNLPASDDKATRYVNETCTRVSELENDIQALSHRLHSSKLEYLGLEAAAKSFCQEFSERENVKVEFSSDGIPEILSNEISLCLFRVLQEAVHNAVKYSGVAEVEVSLRNVSNEIQLRVHDSGVGFDPSNARDGHGLGLTSMKERLRLVNGQLSIDSKRQHGTTIVARVLLAQEAKKAFTAA